MIYFILRQYRVPTLGPGANCVFYYVNDILKINVIDVCIAPLGDETTVTLPNVIQHTVQMIIQRSTRCCAADLRQRLVFSCHSRPQIPVRVGDVPRFEQQQHSVCTQIHTTFSAIFDDIDRADIHRRLTMYKMHARANHTRPVSRILHQVTMRC